MCYPIKQTGPTLYQVTTKRWFIRSATLRECLLLSTHKLQNQSEEIMMLLRQGYAESLRVVWQENTSPSTNIQENKSKNIDKSWSFLTSTTFYCFKFPPTGYPRESSPKGETADKTMISWFDYVNMSRFVNAQSSTWKKFITRTGCVRID